jgi:hypothetical protein
MTLNPISISIEPLAASFDTLKSSIIVFAIAINKVV